MQASENLWQELFATEGSQGNFAEIRMRILRKNGRPFLLLPSESRTAASTLDLYPPQTARGRCARAFLRALLRAGITAGTEKIALKVPLQGPFVNFLNSVCGQNPGTLRRFGILAGNPATEGQRFILILFGQDQKPVAVVKAGTTETAKLLIEREGSFLASAPAETAGLPKVLGQFASSRLRALALDFCEGDSPRRQDEAAIAPLLGSWVQANQRIALGETRSWSILTKAAPNEQTALLREAELPERQIHPAIQHGDFVPWNIKVSRAGEWQVLDWERGELLGIPAWDWFHYLIQPAILVRRESTSELVQRVEAFLAKDSFQDYVRGSGIGGFERPLLLAYLLHMVHVIKPSEGLSENRELLGVLVDRGRILEGKGLKASI